MSMVELARILSRLAPGASAGPLLSEAARHRLDLDPFANANPDLNGQGALTFGGTLSEDTGASSRGRASNRQWFNLSHGGEFQGGAAQVWHRRHAVGPAEPNYTLVFASNMDGMVPLSADVIMSMVEDMDRGGQLSDEDLFDAIP
jgi:hypothetical protein